MKPLKRLFLCIAGVLAASVANLPAQTLTVLHNFSASTNTVNADGENPNADLEVSGTTLYGTAPVGGSYGWGTIYSVCTSGSNFTVLHAFSGGSDGATPNKSLILAGNNFYGLVGRGTNLAGYGSVFSIATNGSNFTIVYTFTATGNGVLENPNGGLLFSNGTLFGTANEGGISSGGTIFSIDLSTTNFSLLHQFVSATDGKNPLGVMVLTNGVLYGTTRNGGSNGTYGTVFSISTNGDNYTVLHTFAGTPQLDGANPDAGLVLSGNVLCGTTGFGGANGGGTVFSITTDGNTYSVLHSFSGSNDIPESALFLNGNTLYGTTLGNGSSGSGEIFSINTDGSSFTPLHTFSTATASDGYTNADGAKPYSTPVMSGTVLYGTTSQGGVNGNGVVFSLGIVPKIIAITVNGPNVLLNAINGIAGNTYTVLASSNLRAPLTNWTSVATNVLASGGNFSITATNAIPAFFILKTP